MRIEPLETRGRSSRRPTEQPLTIIPAEHRDENSSAQPADHNEKHRHKAARGVLGAKLASQETPKSKNRRFDGSLAPIQLVSRRVAKWTLFTFGERPDGQGQSVTPALGRCVGRALSVRQ